MLVIKEDDYNSLWAELQWPGEKFDRVMGYFRRYAGVEEGLSRERLSKLLLDLGKSCYTVRGGVSSMTERGDLCWIMSGSGMLSGSQFMCLAGLLDNSTPHSTSSPAGLLRLEMIFMYYDRGNKGYWNVHDWEFLMKDIQYPAENGEKLVPYPLPVDQNISFETLKKLVDTRRLRGTSQLLRVSFEGGNPDKTSLEETKQRNSNKSKDSEKPAYEANENSDESQTCNLKQGHVEYVKLSEKTTYSPILHGRVTHNERFQSGLNTQKLQVFSPRKKGPERNSPSRRRPQKQSSEALEESNMDQVTQSPRPLSSRGGAFIDFGMRPSAYQDGVSSYMTKIPVIPSSPNTNYTPRMAFRGSVVPNQYFTVNDGRTFIVNQAAQSVVPSAIQHIPYQIPVNAPYHNMPIQQNIHPATNYISPRLAAQVKKGVVESGASGASGIVDDTKGDLHSFNKLQTFGQSLQNVGQSIMSIIPKVFSVPNITVGAGNYSYVSQEDVQRRGGKGLSSESVGHRLQCSPVSITNTNEQPEMNRTYGSSEKGSLEEVNSNLDEALGNGMALPNFHSTYSNENYPMSIDLTKLNIVSLPAIPENASNFNSYKVGDSIKESSVGSDGVKQNNIDEEPACEAESSIRRPIRIEDVDHFFTFMEQLLYNEIVGSEGLFGRIVESHESSFQLTDKEEMLIGPVMQLVTMDQFVLTFALNCVVSHQYSDNSHAQNEGVLGNGVSIDKVGEKIDKLIDLFHRIYRIMYQDLSNEVERNGGKVLDSGSKDRQDSPDNDTFIGYSFLPYIVKMVWEKVRTAMEGDLDVMETIKDICVVYYHYLLESNGSFTSENGSQGSPTMRYNSVEEMIEIVRQRYVVAMKMLSLNNSAKTNSAEAKRMKSQSSEKEKELVDTRQVPLAYQPNIQNQTNSQPQARNRSFYQAQGSSKGEGLNLILKEVDRNVFVPVAKSRASNSSPHYPLLTATSSPNYNWVHQNMVSGAESSAATVGGNSSRRGLVLDSGEFNPIVIPCVLQESAADMENSSEHHHNKVLGHQEPVSGKRSTIGGLSFVSAVHANSSHANVGAISAKAPTNVASYCPAEHTLTDKIPETRLERKSRIPSRIL
ncbi:hypothetical protein OJ253_1858 [Cryptosporidium canis]|uniref:Uncharacterized protein n=1 Tax=Cryptosporidium canis TaxID=195482 RepID=A0A9D5DG76_9CRYT|nr:hypothetical protein OJ253_1858 [Cryptosporidium canis]